MEKRPTRSVSHKGEKVCSYTVDFKLEVVRYAEQSSIHAAGRKYNVSRSSVRDWKKKKFQLEDLKKSSGSGAHRRRLSGGGRKVFDSSTERSLIEWITERKRQGLTISGALIIKKAKSLQQEKLQQQQEQEQQEQQQQQQQQGQQGQHQKIEEEEEHEQRNIEQEQHADQTSPTPKKTASNRLSYSRGWLEKFMNRNGLALKNFPTYQSPVVTSDHTKMEYTEQLPTVIPLDDLLGDELRDDGSFLSSEIRGDGSIQHTQSDIHRDSTSLDHTTDDIRHHTTDDIRHELRTSNISTYDIRKSRQLDNQLIETPTRTTFNKIRYIHTPSVIPIDEAYVRSPPSHTLYKNEPESYGHSSASSSTMYPKSRLDDVFSHSTPRTTYHLTRDIETTYPHTITSNTFYKSRTDDTFSHSSDDNKFHKTRLDNTYSYTSPNTTLHKSRLHEQFPYTTTNSSFQKSTIEDSYVYTSPNTTILKTRIDGTYTYTSSSAFHRSRDMQNPIVIPLDDILPE